MSSPVTGRKYRVAQWATGSVGKAAIRHFVASPSFELAGVLVYSADKVGLDAGDIAGTAPTGVLATDDVEHIMGLDVDCVFYAPILPDVEAICRLLRSGKNVVTTCGPFHRTDDTAAALDLIEQACRDGGASYHTGGIHPGYAGDLLPLTLARITSRVDSVEVFEVVNFRQEPSKYIEWIGMGKDPKEFFAGPTLLGAAVPAFAQSMAVIADGLGRTIDKVTIADIEVAVATADIHYVGTETSDIPGVAGVVRAGTVAGQHHRWTAWVDGAPLIVFNAVYTMGDQDLSPAWNAGDSHYRIVISGDPPSEMILRAATGPDGHAPYLGYTWTAMAAVNAIPAVCESAPGHVGHVEVGLPRLPGVLRP
ncbi:NAD(P)H-dependent amine dehydrogenase family protein [Nocardia bovistercoris]|uniref:Dihydrodipicolinate reductase n=1 Tax=Nocardia bovistercoris TaxID=2785916 RepID=A0A931N6D5_9NOCA|nr:dihydrodipicolinate reductase [Nocardia bovistercoris]MBH0780844.1 dihydrodipicolinate reductase [Nocardia bovistercoris]